MKINGISSNFGSIYFFKHYQLLIKKLKYNDKI